MILEIAEPIPMKSELKRNHPQCRHHLPRYCRAYPDEKGIETDAWLAKSWSSSIYCRAYPDEKGIETRSHFAGPPKAGFHCRAYPDEKGIETQR